MQDNIKNYIYGAIAGSCATLISHPFYVVKNHLQNGYSFQRNIHFNPKWLYAGLLRAMISYSTEKMIIFGIYNTMRDKNFDPLFAGSIAGFFASFTIAPGEQLAIDKALNVKKYNLLHLYQGLSATMFREMLGFAIHFKVYSYLSETYNKEKNEFKTILCGTTAVISGWGTITPIDRIKTQIQSGKFDFKTYNFTSSYNGFSFALMRAIPFHVTCFLVMEYLNKKNEWDL